jgi:hypothetical protein
VCGPQAINNFCREMGVTRSDNMIHLHKLEFHVRHPFSTVSISFSSFPLHHLACSKRTVDCGFRNQCAPSPRALFTYRSEQTWKRTLRGHWQWHGRCG